MMHDGQHRRRLAGARLDNRVCAMDALKPANLAVRFLRQLYARAALAYSVRGSGRACSRRSPSGVGAPCRDAHHRHPPASNMTAIYDVPSDQDLAVPECLVSRTEAFCYAQLFDCVACAGGPGSRQPGAVRGGHCSPLRSHGCRWQGMPVADALAGDPQLAGDLGLAEAGGEQLSSAQPASLAAFTLLLCRSTAGSGWHALILPGQATSSNSTAALSGQPPRPII
jgi:hypothetical protein